MREPPLRVEQRQGILRVHVSCQSQAARTAAIECNDARGFREKQTIGRTSFSQNAAESKNLLVSRLLAQPPQVT